MGAYKVGYLICVKYPDVAGGCVAWWELKRNTDESMKWKTSDVNCLITDISRR